MSRSRSFFIKAVGVLAAGNVIAQILNLVLIPVITRLYPPDIFGVFSSFMSPALAFVPVVMLGVNTALMYERDLYKKLRLLNFGLNVCLFLSVLLVFLFWCAKEIWRFEYGFGRGTFFVLFLFLFGFGVQRLLLFFTNSIHRYKTSSFARVTDTLIGNSAIALFGKFETGVFGLVFGRLLGLASSIFVLIYNFKRNLKEEKNSFKLSFLRMSELKETVNRYSGFLGYGYLALTIENIVREFTVLLCAFFGGAVFAGYYGLVHRVLYLPSNIFGGAISTVFYNWFMERNGSKQIETARNLQAFYLVQLLLTVTVALSVYMFFSSGGLFALVFGAKWREAGYIAGLLAPAFFLAIPRVVLRPVFDVYKKQKALFILSLLRNVSWVGCFVLYSVLHMENIFILVSLLSVTNVFFQLAGVYFGIYLLGVSVKHILKNVSFLLLVVFLGVGCFYLSVLVYEGTKLEVFPVVCEIVLPLTVFLPFVTYIVYLSQKLHLVPRQLIGRKI